jgi:HlyD family secretion protein
MPTIPVAESPLRPSTRPTARRSRKKVFLRWLKRGTLIAIAGGIVAAIVLAWLPDPVAVDVANVRRITLETEIAEDGRTRVRDRYVVAAPISGELLRIALDPGSVITAGDVLATIVPPPPQLLDARSRDEATARLALATAHERTARAAIAKATAARDVAVRDAARAQQLLERAAITATEHERALLASELATRDLATARAQRAAANAEIDAARAVLGTSRHEGKATTSVVTAPASGRILRVLRDSEGPIAAGTPLFELGDIAGLELVVDVLSSDAARVTQGMHVEIDRWGGEGVLAATVTRVEPAAFTRVSARGVEEQRVRVVAVIEAPPPTLGDGFGVAARIVTWRGDGVLAIPASAVFRHHGEWSVYVVDGERAHLREVDIRHRGRADVEVANLTEGTRVILHPGDSVHENTRVAPR